MTGRYIRWEIERKAGRGRERVEARDRNMYALRDENWRNKECRSGTDTKGSKDGFLADTSNCTGSVTIKLLIMHYTCHLLFTLSGELFVTHLQNDPVCMASWMWRMTTSIQENIHFTKWITKTFSSAGQYKKAVSLLTGWHTVVKEG